MENLYAVIEGRVCLEITLNSDCPFIVECICPGKVLGLCAAVDSDQRICA